MKHIIEIFEAHKPMTEVGFKGAYSKEPKEKLTMPVKSVAEVIKLAADGEEEVMTVLNELAGTVKGAETKGRIKDTISIERKCRDYGMEVADLDDVSDKMILVKDFKDMEALGKVLKDDDRIKKIQDFTDDEDAHGYYGLNAYYKTKNGLVAEIQVITKRAQIYKSLCGHIMYEVIRELVPHAKKDKLAGEIVEFVADCLTKGWIQARKADENNEKIPYPEIDTNDKYEETIKKYVTDTTYHRWQALVDHRTKEINKKLSDKDKSLLEKKSLRDYVENFNNTVNE